MTTLIMDNTDSGCYCNMRGGWNIKRVVKLVALIGGYMGRVILKPKLMRNATPVLKYRTPVTWPATEARISITNDPVSWLASIKARTRAVCRV